eukprot:tig00000718_g3751.t1
MKALGVRRAAWVSPCLPAQPAAARLVRPPFLGDVVLQAAPQRRGRQRTRVRVHERTFEGPTALYSFQPDSSQRSEAHLLTVLSQREEDEFRSESTHQRPRSPSPSASDENGGFLLDAGAHINCGDCPLVSDDGACTVVTSPQAPLERPLHTLAETHAALLEEWVPELNRGVDPAQLATTSARPVWWRCPSGHVYEASVAARTGSTQAGCPHCRPRRVRPGRSLAELYPAVSREWDEERNGALGPEEVAPSSARQAWWRCRADPEAHVWQQSVAARVAGGRLAPCPYCSGRKVLAGESLAARFPRIAAQWHPTRNKESPEQVSPNSFRRVWWMCPSHEWQSTVYARTRLHDAGCPICERWNICAGNNLLARFPAVAAELDAEANGGVTAAALAPGSNKKVWWRCGAGHAWLASPAMRTASGTGCPECAAGRAVRENNLAERYPRWPPSSPRTSTRASPRAGPPPAPPRAPPPPRPAPPPLTRRQLSAGSGRRLWWRCGEGHVWQSTVLNRTAAGRSGRCPQCTGRRATRERSLLGTHPALAAQFHPELNAPEVTAGSGRKVVWKCPQGDDHVWAARVRSRTAAKKAAGCPFCAGLRVPPSRSLAARPSSPPSCTPRRTRGGPRPRLRRLQRPPLVALRRAPRARLARPVAACAPRPARPAPGSPPSAPQAGAGKAGCPECAIEGLSSEGGSEGEGEGGAAGRRSGSGREAVRRSLSRRLAVAERAREQTLAVPADPRFVVADARSSWYRR